MDTIMIVKSCIINAKNVWILDKQIFNRIKIDRYEAWIFN
jgi:hypothetical protein